MLRTNVVFSETGLLLSTWLLVSCLIFSIKELWIRQNSITGKATAIIAGISFIISLNYLDAGWTSYPPLEALGQKQLTSEIFNRGILATQIITGVFMVTLLFWWIRKHSVQQT
jgi:heme/copper-type cytochrome/quinol oxidase subunit 1